jgi:phosphoribosylformylglycinamidine synthase
LLASPNLASRRPLFEQYDCLVQSRTVVRPGDADAAVLLVNPIDGPATHDPHVDRPAMAVSIDGNGRRVAADPYWGSVAVVVECAANLACVGAEPLGATDNLSFGNPEKPHVAWQLTESVRGLGDACRALSVPIVGGNVSLYNDGPAGPIYPTPVIGMVGHLPDARRAGRMGFARAGTSVALVGPFLPTLGACELAKLWGEHLPDGLPAIDLDLVAAALAAVRHGVRSGALESAHDVAEGGLAVALAECCLAGGIGAEVELPTGWPQPVAGAGRGDTGGSDSGDEIFRALFGEGSGGFVVSGSPAALDALAATTPVTVIGTVGGDSLTIAAPGGRIHAGLADLTTANASLKALFP